MTSRAELAVTNSEIEHMRVLGVPISIVNMAAAVSKISAWGKSGPARTVFVRDVHGLMRSLEDPILFAMHDEANMVVPDGMPLTGLARLRGYKPAQIARTPGPDVMLAVCERSVADNTTHYFFGGKPGVAQTMAAHLKRTYPGLRIVGTFSPPMRDIDGFRDLTEEELTELDMIKEGKPDFIWIGLSSPKQEYWMMKAKDYLDHGVLLGVGAAFDFHAGTIRRAPAFMREYGLEWLHRLLSEPRRLWRRYLVLAPMFVYRVAREELLRRLRR
ncbi:WecB/TagA/CpsF family glycosyltransferase [Bradyrhizobium vignae]|uniref:WecB/TagA/CpsF family glycosyltransferase n=1 Tax=Bradyrhizobium vignae TaxID=1549949 RepID=A0ABS3ZQB1_9BRAD|nr:WecB/TagA/CpsF family glycosyltransferase [Bradyrhizobium vignae]MBP0110348.1 WecB/TagA/CpsF family glycosyltransferase [Bradyrhizobium vignae]